MQKLKHFIYPNIAKISIGLGILGMVSNLLLIFFNDLKFLQYFRLVKIQDFTGYLFKAQGKINPEISLVSLLFFTMMIVGGILYKKSQTRDSRLVRFVFGILCVDGLLNLMSLPFDYVNQQLILKSNLAISEEALGAMDYAILGLTKMPIIILAYFITTWIHENHSILFIKKQSIGTEQIFLPMTVGKSVRFTHAFFDYLFSLFLVLPFVSSLIVFFIRSAGPDTSLNTLDKQWYVSLVLLFSLTLYYLLFEGLFKTTPMKFLTGTRVLDAVNFKTPGIGKIVGRTLIRRFPFNAFSFLGGKGWHDLYSETIVAKEDDQGNRGVSHRYWGVILFALYLVPLGFYKFQDEKLKKMNRQENESIHTAKRGMLLKQLNYGDVIVGSIQKRGMHNEYTCLKIIDTQDKDSIRTIKYNAEFQYMRDRNDVINNMNTSNFLLEDTLILSRKDLNDLYFQKIYSLALDSITNFQLRDIYDLDHPQIRSTGSEWNYSTEKDSGVYNFVYDLFQIKVLDIEHLEGDVEWIEDLSTIQSSYNELTKIGYFSIPAHRINKKRPFKAKITVEYNGENHVYMFRGIGSNTELFRMIE
jgi:hypothetical protein